MFEMKEVVPPLELPSEQLEVYLSWLGLKNHYAEYAVDYYRQSLSAHESASEEGESGDELPSYAELNGAMLDLAIATDEPELAMYFLGQTESVEELVDLYFRTQPHPKSNAAEKAINDALENLPEYLEADPRTLCKFLVRGIGELGPVGRIDIASSVQTVLKIVNDKQVFPQDKYISIYNKLTNDSPEGVRYYLALALLKCGEYEFADQIVDDLPEFTIRSRDNGTGYYASDMYKYEKWLAQALRGELSKKDKREIERTAQSGLSHWHAANSYSALCMAISGPASAFNNDHFRYGDSGRGDDIVLVRDRGNWGKYAREHPSRFLWRELPKQFHELYGNMFPHATARYWLKLNTGGIFDTRYQDTQEEAVERVRAIATSGNHNLADYEFHSMLEGRNSYHYHTPARLKAAVAMAEYFSVSPLAQLDLEASIAAEAEMLERELNTISIGPTGVVEESEHRQRLDAKVEAMLIRIEDLNQETRKQIYFKQLFDVISDAQAIDPKIKQAAEVRLAGQEGRFVRENLFKIHRPSELPDYLAEMASIVQTALDNS